MTMEKAKQNDLTQLARLAHANSAKHGFWDAPHSDQHCLCLVVSELMEAVEAHRCGRNADMEAFEKYRGMVDEQENFERQIKDTVGDELADAVIRLLDLAGRHDAQLDRAQCRLFTVVSPSQTLTENVFAIVVLLATWQESGSSLMVNAIQEIEGLCGIMGVDLWWHVEAKMKYNAGREYMHGKKY